jgi:Raf kinase inhibitor-like YbhB/YbcL family protein
MSLSLTSPEFKHDQSIPAKFTCQGENINPVLTFSEVPDKTASLVLIMDDPDAATDPDGPGKTFDHWILFNMKPDVTVINENTVPSSAVVGKNSAGINAYTGPCPPNGTHKYIFKLYALSTMLNLKAGETKAEVLKALAGHVLEQSELIGLYRKTKKLTFS